MRDHTKALKKAGAFFQSDEINPQREDDTLELKQLLNTATEDQMTVIQSNPNGRDLKRFGEAMIRISRMEQLQRKLG